MSQAPVHSSFEAKNAPYVETFGDKSLLPIPPAKKIAIVTCMDARLNPAAHLGLAEGDAHVIRNAGGIAKDSLRSLLVSQRLLGTREIAVFHHTECGMLTFSTAQLRADIKAHAAPELAPRVDALEFLEFADVTESVKEDVAWVKGEPLLLPGTVVTGWIYDVRSGKVSQVV